MKNEVRIGVDTGGTFTDFVIFADGKVEIKKVPSTPKNPARSILEGLNGLLERDLFLRIIHGTTVATNSLLERKGGKIALIATKNFEDILFIARQTRRKLYNLKGEERIPLLPRHRCYGLEERTSASGEIERSISQANVTKVLEWLEKVKVEAVAVSLINSYANSTNEKIISEQLKKREVFFCLSSDILPEHREYERTATTTVNTYLMPVISQYLKGLEKKLPKADLRIMQSNEGYISPSKAEQEPIRTALSGPAGGVIGAFHLAKTAGIRRIITFDMGGTSSDVSLLDGKIKITNESFIGDFPVRIPIIDIHTVGAGGGSIAFTDKGGSLRVGPQSAGADPGPACYGKGKEPTVTDANLILGRLVPEFFLGGRMKIFSEKSRRALQNLAKKINKSLLETAEGIIDIANANMEKAIRVISIEKGFDPRDFMLFSFGGAGGMHAADIAQHLQLPGIIVPKNAGVLSAFGLLLADSIKDHSKSLLTIGENISKDELEKHFSELEKNSIKDMKEDGFLEEEVSIFRYLDLRYFGQSYEITIPYRAPNKSALSFVSDFHREHKKIYSYHQPHRAVEIVNIRVKAVCTGEKIKLQRLHLTSTSPKKALIKKQEIYYKERKYLASVYDRSLLKAGNRMRGPALILDPESTTFLPPEYGLEVDGFLNLLLRRKK